MSGLVAGMLDLPGPQQQAFELMGFAGAGHDALFKLIVGAVLATGRHATQLLWR